jgi:hypothetical protein
VQGSNSTFVQSTNNSGLQNLMTYRSVLPITDNGNDYPPEAVMRTALTDTNGNMTIFFPDNNPCVAFMSFYYAELDPTANATSRNYYIEPSNFSPNFVNPVLNQSNSSSDIGNNFPNVITFGYFQYSAGWNILLYPDPTSPLGPLVNAFEFLESEEQMATLTNLQDGELIIWSEFWFLVVF